MSTLTSTTKSEAEIKQNESSSTSSIRFDGLLAPQDSRASDVVIFDGECSFCESQVRRLKKWDGKDRLSFVSLHDPFVAEEFPDLTHDEMMRQIYVVANQDGVYGKRYGGAAALRYLTRRLPKLWLAMPFLHIPFSLPLWQWAYRQIAKRRYTISKKYSDSCDNGSCDVHFNSND